MIRNHHKSSVDYDTFNQVKEFFQFKETKYTTPKDNPYNKFVFYLMHDKYLHWISKVPNKPAYDLLENEYKRKQGTPRIYSKTATHVTRKATIALARKFNELEAKFDKQVNKRLKNKPLERKLKNLGNDLKGYKDEYFKLIKKTILDPADKALIKELEDIIINKSIEYVRIEDEALPQKGSTSRVKEIKKSIRSIELPMVEFPVDKMKQILERL